jgi:NADP-dependent 3-hydroxy acid dehydrogenase YdfG
MIRLNVLSHSELTKGLVPALKGKGHVFHMASVASRKMFVNKPSYSISKHAQLALTDAFRHELRPLGIRVTTVMPGPTWSASWENVDFPEERLLDPRHIADLMWHAWNLPQEVDLEELVIRPREGDID